jgi:hypothetical protein
MADVTTEENDTQNDESDIKSVKFYNQFDGTKGRQESVYLDMQEREEAEKIRAIREDRDIETDLGKLPASVGTPVVTEAYLIDNSYYSNPSTSVLGARDVDPVAELDVNVDKADTDVDLGYAAQVAKERKAQEDNLAPFESSSTTDTTTDTTTDSSNSSTSGTAVEAEYKDY